MAIIDANYDCACGFSTTKPLAALDHVNSTHHTLAVRGVIKPGIPKPDFPAQEKQHQAHEQSQMQIVDDFGSLRHKLGKQRRQK